MGKAKSLEDILPVGDRVCIEPIEEPNTKGTIYVPDSAKPKPTRGTIISVGSGVTDLTKGMTVIFPKYNGVDVEVDGKEYIVMHESDVIAVVYTSSKS